MKHYKIYCYFTFLIFNFTIIAAPLTNLPITIKQPDGKVIHCFASGDEFHNWIHDKDNYTFIQDQKTGYWTYAVKDNNIISSSNYIVGKDDPKALNLQRGINLSPEEILQKRNNILKARFSKRLTSLQNLALKNALAPSKGIVNNLAIFVRFADDPEFTEDISYYEKLFNTGESSVRNYFLEDSYGKLTLNTHFFPKSDNKILSYRDIYPRGYYVSHNEVTNPDGYKDGYESDSRENELLKRILNSIKNQIPENVDFDADKDGRIDNICFIIYGTSPGYNQLLWPHYGRIWDTLKINNKNVNGYAFLMNVPNTSSDYIFNTSCHELGHSIGFPDLYRYNNPGEPVGRWDMMSRNVGHSGAWMKYKYMRWIDSIPEIQQEGKYTLNDITKPSNNCYKIRSAVSSEEFLVVEYRKKEGLFEKDIPGSGLLITRINPSAKGNGEGPPDEIYYYRPQKDGFTYGDIMNAFFSSESGRTKLNLNTNPPLVLSNNIYVEMAIYDIGSSHGPTMGFSIKRKNKISVTSNKNYLDSKAGSFTLSINYLFSNQNNSWTVSIISGQSWLSAISPVSGINNGRVDFSYAENSTGDLLTEIIRISDPESCNTPIDFKLYQSPENSMLEIEPNNYTSIANKISPGIVCYASISPAGDQDTYKFSAIEGDTVEIQYTDNNNPNLGHIGFYKIVNNYTSQLPVIQKTESEIIRYIAVIPKTDDYYMVVNCSNGQYVFNYNLGIKRYVNSTLSPKIKKFSVSGRDNNSVLTEIQIATYGQPTTLKVEYGLTTNYDKTFTFNNASYSGFFISNFILSIFEKISGLSPNTNYHFRLIAQNANGTDYSDDCESTTNSTLFFISEVEPNQTKEQATQIYYGDSICASISSSSDVDYYKFYARSGDMVAIRLNDSSNASKAISCFWVYQSMYMPGSNNNGIITTKYNIPETGIYCLSVQNKSGNNSPFNYSLVLDKFKYSAPKYISKNFYGIDNIVETNYNSIRIYPGISTSGLPTTIKIEYGTTRNYGKTYLYPDLISNSNFYNDFLIYVPMVVSGLEPNTTYHFRVIVENELGKDISKDYKFTTLQKSGGLETTTDTKERNFNKILPSTNNGLLATSYYGGIIKSTDLGKSWNKCDSDITFAIEISSADRVNFVAGCSQDLYKSTDGGNNWFPVFKKSNSEFRSIYCLDKKNTFIAGRSYSTSPNTYFILKTTDGGNNWDTLVNNVYNQYNKILFTNENNGFVLLNKGVIIKTTDGGKNWIEQNTDTTYSLNNIFFTDHNNGFVVGHYYQINLKTDSSGKIYNSYSYYPLILRTTNNGNTWERLNLTAKNALSYITFNDKYNGIIVGEGGVILKTTNGGITWIEQPGGTDSRLTGACFLDPSTVIISGYNGTIIKFYFNSEPIYETTDFKLSNNYPNPFNSQTNIEYSIPEDGLVRIKIYDILGREIETILNENQKSGKYGISWKPQNVATGIYYYRIEAGKYKETKKLLYLK